MEVCSQETWNDANHIKDQPGTTLHLTHLTFLRSILDSIVCLRHMHALHEQSGRCRCGSELVPEDGELPRQGQGGLDVAEWICALVNGW